MNYLVRAIKLSLQYKWSLIGAIVCSFMVAVMWGANIGAVYPFVEVVFEGKSLPDWVNERIASSETRVAEIDEEVAELRQDLESAGPDERSEIEKTIKLRETVREGERKKGEMAVWLKPTIDRWTPATGFGTLVLLVVFLVGATFIRGIFLMGSMVLVTRVGQRTVLDLQNTFFRNTLHLDLATINEQGTGDLIGRIRGETGAIGSAITMLYGKTTREPLKMIACLVGAGLVNWRLLLLSLIIAPFATYLMLVLAKSIKNANKKAFEEGARLANRLFQAVTYIKMVKTSTMESHERRRFATRAHDVYRKGMKIAVYSSLFRMNNELLGIGIISVSILAGGYLVINQKTELFGITMCSTPMSLGEIMVFYAFLIGVSDPIRKMGDVYSCLQGGIVAAERVFPLLDRKSKIVEPKDPRSTPAGPAAIKFDKVCFEYLPNTPILREVSFEIKAGEAIGVVGANGSGKSTLINLLPRFYDPNSGNIFLDGHNLREYRSRDLRRYLGYVTQQTVLFDDSILENIRYGCPKASMDDVVAAAKKAHAHHFIMNDLEEGYETGVGEHGGRLSGGQRQRIALARAILRDPQLLILDEATSQIDPESEWLIHRTMEAFIKDRTAIMITHRLSTLELASRILVMEEGRVAGFGTHDELMRDCLTYQRLRQTDLRESA